MRRKRANFMSVGKENRILCNGLNHEGHEDCGGGGNREQRTENVPACFLFPAYSPLFLFFVLFAVSWFIKLQGIGEFFKGITLGGEDDQ